jgi:hypothetical protein
MKGTSPIDNPLPIPQDLLRKIGGEQELTSPDGRGVGSEGRDNNASIDNPNDDELTRALRQWRAEAAEKSRVPLYHILSNATMLEIIEKRPTSSERLLDISGIGPGKLARFGDAILSVVRGFTSNAGQISNLSADSGQISNPPITPVPSKTEFDESSFVGHAPFERDPFDMDSSTQPWEQVDYFEGSEAPPQVEAASVPAQNEPPLSTAEPSKPPYYWTWRLMKVGFPPDQCAAIRGVPTKTILEHARQAAENGLEIRPEWILEE